MTPYRIGVFTANRAEYGLLAPLMKAIQQTDDLLLVTLVAQDHWLTGTVSEITGDGFVVDIALKPNPTYAAVADPGRRMTLLAADLMRQLGEQPLPLDALVILGDRFEAAACALAARLLAIPILHIGGGDTTAGGCVDDDMRDVISRLARWHAVATAKSFANLQAKGIDPRGMVVTGSLVRDNLQQLTLIPKASLFNQLGLDPNRPVLLFTQHPIPAEGLATVTHFDDSLTALKQLTEETHLQVVATYPNMDGFANELADVIARHDWATWVPSLGRLRYLSLMAECRLVVGNTSSGLIETPFFDKASVTIGPRQAGRERAENVVACDYGVEAVKTAIIAAMVITRVKHNPFGVEPAAPKILEMLRTGLSTHVKESGEP